MKKKLKHLGHLLKDLLGAFKIKRLFEKQEIKEPEKYALSSRIMYLGITADATSKSRPL